MQVLVCSQNNVLLLSCYSFRYMPFADKKSKFLVDKLNC